MSIDMDFLRCTKCRKTYFFESDSEYSYSCPNCGSILFLDEARMKCRTDEEIAADPVPVYDIFSDPDSPYYIPKVKCPYCNSTDTQKINLAEKATNTAVFGLFGTKRHKQYHCNKCKSDF